MLDQPLRDLFDTPELAAMDDVIANGALQVSKPSARSPGSRASSWRESAEL